MVAGAPTGGVQRAMRPGSRTHFLLPMPPAPGKGRARGTAGFCAALTFALGPELTAHPGYYELLPVR